MKNKIVLFFPRPWPGSSSCGRPPYSLLHLVSYLERKNDPFEVKIIDQRVTPDIVGEAEKIDWSDVICAGVSSFTGIQIKYGLGVADAIRAKAPNTPIVWGGWHPSLLPEQTAQDDRVDIVVRHQGEETFRALAYALRDGTPLAQVTGITYKEKGGPVTTNPDRPLTDYLGDMRINYKLVDVEQFLFKQPWAEKNIGMITSLGCPYNCSFCSVVVTYKRKTFFRDLDVVMDEIDYLVKEHGVDGITFDDDNFLVQPERIKDLARRLIQRNYKLKWDAGAHVNILMTHFSEEDLALLKRSGCEQLYIGAESGSDEVLEILNKRATVGKSIAYVEKMHKAGIRSFLSTMVAFPGMGDIDLSKTMEFILKCKDMDPNLHYRLFYYTPYPGTDLYQSALDAGMIEPKTLVDWSNHTLRKFKAPWIKEYYRARIRQFYFYYFPYYSGEIKSTIEMVGSPLKKAAKWLYKKIFFNELLIRMATWRVKHSNYRFPLDAQFAVFGQRLRSIYGRIFFGNVDMYADYSD